MFKAMLLICSLVHGSGDEKLCFQINDTIAPDGYITEKKCRVRVKEMADMVTSIVPYPHVIKYKCENKIMRTSFEDDQQS
jgi:hypothetical protein